MKVIETDFEGVKVIEPDFFGDARGWFCEQYNAERYRAYGLDFNFVQDNESLSSKGVVRGLHWQTGKWAQTKLVRVIHGAVWDVIVDIRLGSPTYGKCFIQELSDKNHLQLLIPRGFAHGFIVLEDNTLFSYKCDNVYCKESERGMSFMDSKLAIKFPELDLPLKFSEKDLHHPNLDAIEPYEGSK